MNPTILLSLVHNLWQQVLELSELNAKKDARIKELEKQLNDIVTKGADSE